MTPSLTCCGRRPRDISIDLSSHTLVVLYCARCERRQWLRDGAPVDLTAAKNTMAATHKRKKVSA